jgi:hypothetical protein
MIESADKDYYGFEYGDCDGKVYKTRINGAGPTWMEALDDYVNFLQTVFKYDIKSKVRVEEPVWFGNLDSNDFESYTGWGGGFFVKDDEEDTE